MLTIVFDLDGTLIDTAPDLISTLNLILAREGMAAIPFEAARRMIGGGARAMIEKAVAAEGRDGSKAEIDRMVGHFIDHYAAHIADHSAISTPRAGAGPSRRQGSPARGLHQQARMALRQTS